MEQPETTRNVETFSLKVALVAVETLEPVALVQTEQAVVTTTAGLEDHPIEPLKADIAVGQAAAEPLAAMLVVAEAAAATE